MISLLFKILANASPWRKVVTQDMPKDAKKAGKEAGHGAGKEFGQQMKSAVMSYLGAGAVLGALRSQATRATEILRDAASQDLGTVAFQELELAAKASGMAIKDIQEMALQLPAQFEAMMKPIRENGGILGEDQVKELAQIKQVMDEASNAAAKFFSIIWKTGKFAAEFATYVGMFLGATALQVPAAFGHRRSEELSRDIGTQAVVGIERMVGRTPDPLAGQPDLNSDAAANFARESKRKKDFDDWWESVGGPEASMLGSNTPSRLTSSENVYTNADLITRDNMQRPRGSGTSVSSPQVVSKLEQIRQTLESRL